MHQSIAHLKPVRLVSRLLRGNPMGNASERSFYVLEPAYPADHVFVCYVLDGYFGNGTSMLNHPGPVGRSFADELIEYQISRMIPSTLFVFADCSTRIGGSQYLNSESCGRFEDHLFDEVMPTVENLYPVIKTERLVTGHSSGGYGALRLPISRPGVFRSSIVSAADSCFEHSMLPCFNRAAVRLQHFGGVDSFLDAFFAHERPEKCSPADFTTLMVLAMASCYSPEIGTSTIHARLPFDTTTLELIDPVWELWKSFDPCMFADGALRTLEGLGHLHLDVGSADEHAAQYGHRRICRRLRALGIRHNETEFKGGHSGTRHRYRFRLEKWAQFLRSAGHVW